MAGDGLLWCCSCCISILYLGQYEQGVQSHERQTVVTEGLTILKIHFRFLNIELATIQADAHKLTVLH